MAYNVTLRQSGRQFQVEPDEPVLTAALRQGVGVPYGCKNGACGSCKGAVVSGEISQGAHSSSALSNDEKTRGMALFCCATAQSDLVIDVREIAGVGDVQVKKLPCRVNALERKADDVMILKLQLPANERLQYLAGQYVEFILKDGKRRSYSMASAPNEEGPIELHIRHMPGGVFTDHVFNTMKERDILRFEGPLGTFFLREESDKPVLLLASGTGFAPVKALVEHMIHLKSERPVALYWGGRRPQDLYMHDLCEQWARELPRFTYVPVISDALPEDAWTGRTGFVHAAVMQDIPDLSNHQVYACGAPIMVDSARRDYVERCGLPADEFYADAFTTEADLAQP